MLTYKRSDRVPIPKTVPPPKKKKKKKRRDRAPTPKPTPPPKKKKKKKVQLDTAQKQTRVQPKGD